MVRLVEHPGAVLMNWACRDLFSRRSVILVFGRSLQPYKMIFVSFSLAPLPTPGGLAHNTAIRGLLFNRRTVLPDHLSSVLMASYYRSPPIGPFSFS